MSFAPREKWNLAPPCATMRAVRNGTQIPVALTIAVSDSGGGAGIQADLKTFASLGAHGTSVITWITAQNPAAVTRVAAVSAAMVRAQLEAVFAELPPKAVKTGMLYSPVIVSEVAAFLALHPDVPFVVDPVMIATSGASLAKPSAVRRMTDQLLPRAALVTPNLPEAQRLTGQPIRSVDDLRQAARRIHALFGCPTLVKGGHLPDVNQAVDFLYDGKGEWMFSAPFVKGVSTHGTGCAFSAAVTAHLALGRALPEAVAAAKNYITQAIAQSLKVGKYTVLNHFWK